MATLLTLLTICRGCSLSIDKVQAVVRDDFSEILTTKIVLNGVLEQFLSQKMSSSCYRGINMYVSYLVRKTIFGIGALVLPNRRDRCLQKSKVKSQNPDNDIRRREHNTTRTITKQILTYKHALGRQTQAI